MFGVQYLICYHLRERTLVKPVISGHVMALIALKYCQRNDDY